MTRRTILKTRIRKAYKELGKAYGKADEIRRIEHKKAYEDYKRKINKLLGVV